MNRRSFLKFLGLGVVAAPVAVEVVKKSIEKKCTFPRRPLSFMGIPVIISEPLPSPGQVFFVSKSSYAKIVNLLET